MIGRGQLILLGLLASCASTTRQPSSESAASAIDFKPSGEDILVLDMSAFPPGFDAQFAEAVAEVRHQQGLKPSKVSFAANGEEAVRFASTRSSVVVISANRKGPGEVNVLYRGKNKAASTLVGFGKATPISIGEPGYAAFRVALQALGVSSRAVLLLRLQCSREGCKPRLSTRVSDERCLPSWTPVEQVPWEQPCVVMQNKPYKWEIRLRNGEIVTTEIKVSGTEFICAKNLPLPESAQDVGSCSSTAD